MSFDNPFIELPEKSDIVHTVISYVEIEYIPTKKYDFTTAGTDLAVKLLIVTDTHLIKATSLASEITKTTEIVNKNSKIGKMTVVVKTMKVNVSK